MSKRDEEDFAAFLRELEAMPTEPRDMGPAARRAAAGLPPGPRDVSAEQAGTMAGPIRGKLDSSPFPEPRSYGQKLAWGGVIRPEQPVGPAEVGAGDVTVQRNGALANYRGLAPGGTRINAPHIPGEMDDPLVRAGTAFAMARAAGAAGGGLAGAAPVVGSVVGPVAGGAIEGGVANKAAGGDFVPGAVVGGGLAALGAAGRAAPARADRELLREIDRAAKGKVREKMAAVSGSDLVETARDAGFANVKDWKARAQLSGAAKEKIGADIGNAYKPLDASPLGLRPTDQVVQALEKVKDTLGQTTEGQQLIKVVTEKQEALRKLYPKGIPLSALNREIGDLESLGYSGGQVGQLSQKAASKVPRQMAAAMEDELQSALGAARNNPQLAQSVDAIAGLNKKYKSVLAIDAIANRRAALQPLVPPTLGERAAKMLKGGKAQLAVDVATGLPRAGRAMAEAAGKAINSVPDATVPGAMAAQAPQRKVAPAVVPMIESLSSNNGAGLDKHVEGAVFGP